MIKAIAIAMISAACLTAPAFAQAPAPKTPAPNTPATNAPAIQPPAAATPAPDCATLWKSAHGNAADKVLTTKEAEKLKPVMAKVDANKDGKVSDTEFTVACQSGVLKDVKF